MAAARARGSASARPPSTVPSSYARRPSRGADSRPAGRRPRTRLPGNEVTKDRLVPLDDRFGVVVGPRVPPAALGLAVSQRAVRQQTADDLDQALDVSVGTGAAVEPSQHVV